MSEELRTLYPIAWFEADPIRVKLVYSIRSRFSILKANYQELEQAYIGYSEFWQMLLITVASAPEDRTEDQESLLAKFSHCQKVILNLQKHCLVVLTHLQVYTSLLEQQWQLSGQDFVETEHQPWPEITSDLKVLHKHHNDKIESFVTLQEEELEAVKAVIESGVSTSILVNLMELVISYRVKARTQLITAHTVSALRKLFIYQDQATEE